MPNCRDMAELATDYLDRAMPWHRRVLAWTHLRACAACRAYFDQMRRTVALLRSLTESMPPESEISESDIEAVMRRLNEPTG
ncbi:anti-sigma factor family protein [Rhodopila sp.]|uniref:anti-sigma factor family protein n=1 Tax=Rhodopila sp. TaxID=2480087 RepID=UPI002BAC11C0|nr:hypothetical protein [Rhodopila sp.]HVZ06772.1 hypothetical protein [Rhodopila sp.]